MKKKLVQNKTKHLILPSWKIQIKNKYSTSCNNTKRYTCKILDLSKILCFYYEKSQSALFDKILIAWLLMKKYTDVKFLKWWIHKLACGYTKSYKFCANIDKNFKAGLPYFYVYEQNWSWDTALPHGPLSKLVLTGSKTNFNICMHIPKFSSKKPHQKQPFGLKFASKVSGLSNYLIQSAFPFLEEDCTS